MNSWKKQLSCFLSFLLLIALNAEPWTNVVKADTTLVKERYVVRLKSTSDPIKWIAKKGIAAGKAKELTPRSHTLLLQMDSSTAQKMKADSEVMLVEKDHSFRLFADNSLQSVSKATYNSQKVPSNESESIPWGITATQAVYAHQKGITGQGIKMALLDTGASTSHPDLQLAGGQSFVEEEDTYEDMQGHGTHVAGIINAPLNAYGVVGMAPGAEVYALKVLDISGTGYYSSVIEAIEWCIDNGIQIVSMSFGGMENSEILHQVIQEAATEHGILFVAAAGNNGSGEETETYPARYPEVLSVGAVNSAYQRSAFSSTGTELDITAPGEQVWSTALDGGYNVRSGTSMAAPYVAGAAALIWEFETGLSAEQIRNRLVGTAIDLGDSHEYGAGFVQVMGEQQPLNPVGINPVNNPDYEIRKLFATYLGMQKKAMEQNQAQLGKDIYAAYNQLKIEFDTIRQIPEKLTVDDQLTVGISVYTPFSVTRSVYENAIQANPYQYLETQREPLKQLIAEYQAQLDYFRQLGGEVFATKKMTQSDASQYWNLIGNGQTVQAGELAFVSFESRDAQLSVNISITGPSYGFEDTIDFGGYGQYFPYYEWYTPESLLPGDYIIEMNCTDYENFSWFNVYFTIHVVQSIHIPINLNSTLHANIAEESSSNYMYLSSNKFETITIMTEFLDEYGYDPDCDTVLQIYSDEDALYQIAYNDDSNGTLLSSITLTLRPARKIFIKLSGYGGGSVNANISLYQSPNYFENLSVNAPIDVSYPSPTSGFLVFTPTQTGFYSFITSSYGGNGGLNNSNFSLFSDNTLTQQCYMQSISHGPEIFERAHIKLFEGNSYYLTIFGIYDASVHVRITVIGPDLSPPTAPNQLVISNLTNTNALLSWNTSTDEFGVRSYKIYRNSELIATVDDSTTTYTATGLSANSLYTFTVKAMDISDKLSESSNKVSFCYLTGSITYLYDARGRLNGVQLPSGQIINYAPDANGNTTSIIQP